MTEPDDDHEDRGVMTDDDIKRRWQAYHAFRRSERGAADLSGCDDARAKLALDARLLPLLPTMTTDEGCSACGRDDHEPLECLLGSPSPGDHRREWLRQHGPASTPEHPPDA